MAYICSYILLEETTGEGADLPHEFAKSDMTECVINVSICPRANGPKYSLRSNNGVRLCHQYRLEHRQGISESIEDFPGTAIELVMRFEMALPTKDGMPHLTNFKIINSYDIERRSRKWRNHRINEDRCETGWLDRIAVFDVLRNRTFLSPFHEFRCNNSDSYVPIRKFKGYVNPPVSAVDVHKAFYCTEAVWLTSVWDSCILKYQYHNNFIESLEMFEDMIENG
jgi:hypothetical protein